VAGGTRSLAGAGSGDLCPQDGGQVWTQPAGGWGSSLRRARHPRRPPPAAAASPGSDPGLVTSVLRSPRSRPWHRA